MFEWTETTFDEHPGWKAQITPDTQMLITEIGENRFLVNLKITGKAIIRKTIHDPNLVSQLDVILFAAKAMLPELANKKDELYKALIFINNTKTLGIEWQETKDNWMLPIDEHIRITLSACAPDAFGIKLIGPRKMLLAERIIELSVNTPIESIQQTCLANLSNAIQETIGRIKHAANIIKTEI